MLDDERKKQLGILVKIAMVDEEFADAEMSVIRRLSTKYGASDAELQEIIASPPSSDSLAPMTVADKMDFMMDCMLVILADDMVTSSEQYFARQMATKLGFNHEVIDFLMKHKETSREEMSELLTAFLDS